MKTTGGGFYSACCNSDELVESRNLDDTVKSSRCKARESLGMRRTYVYVGMTEDEAQRSRWTFCEVVFFQSQIFINSCLPILNSTTDIIKSQYFEFIFLRQMLRFGFRHSDLA